MDVPECFALRLVLALGTKSGGLMEQDREVRRLLGIALAACRANYGINREEIARRMTARLGCQVTSSKLDSFTRSGKPGREYRFPLAWTRVVCEVTHNDALARALLPDPLRDALALGELVLDSSKPLEQAVILLRSLKTKAGRKSRKPPR